MLDSQLWWHRIAGLRCNVRCQLPNSKTCMLTVKRGRAPLLWLSLLDERLQLRWPLLQAGKPRCKLYSKSLRLRAATPGFRSTDLW
jgi:hypothetical protein